MSLHTAPMMPSQARKPIRRSAVALAACVLLLTSAMTALPAVAGDDTDEFDTIQEALDAAQAGQAVIVRASSNENPTPYLEALTIKTSGITLCSAPAAETQDPGPVFIGTTDDCKLPQTAGTVVDASTKSPVVLTVKADDVTVTGFTFRWVVSTEQILAPGTYNPVDLVSQATGAEGGVRGIVVDGNNVTINDNQIRIRVGPAPLFVSSASPVPGTGIVIPSSSTGAQILNNDIRVIQGMEGTIGGMWGIVASGNEYLIEGNDISQWAAAGILVTGQGGHDASAIRGNTITENGLYGIHLNFLDTVPAIEANTIWIEGDAAIYVDGTDGAVITDNALVPGVAGGSGVWVRDSDQVQLRGNIFSTIPGVSQQTGFPVTVNGASEGLVLRDNVFRLDAASANRVALHLGSDVQMTHVDARFNDWSVCTWGEVSARVLDAGVTNSVDVTPFRTTC